MQGRIVRLIRTLRGPGRRGIIPYFHLGEHLCLLPRAAGPGDVDRHLLPILGQGVLPFSRRGRAGGGRLFIGLPRRRLAELSCEPPQETAGVLVGGVRRGPQHGPVRGASKGDSHQRIGLLPLVEERIEPVGRSASERVEQARLDVAHEQLGVFRDQARAGRDSRAAGLVRLLRALGEPRLLPPQQHHGADADADGGHQQQQPVDKDAAGDRRHGEGWTRAG